MSEIEKPIKAVTDEQLAMVKDKCKLGEGYVPKDLVLAIIARLEREEEDDNKDGHFMFGCPTCGSPSGTGLEDFNFQRLSELIAEGATNDALDYIGREASDYIHHSPAITRSIVNNRKNQKALRL